MEKNFIVVPTHKNEGDIKRCTNYSEIKLMSHTSKLWKRVMEERLRQAIKILKINLVLSLGGQLWKLLSHLGN